MKTIRIGCPKCGVRLGVTREMQGRTLRCAGCQQHLRFGTRTALNASPQTVLTQSSRAVPAAVPAKQLGKSSSRTPKPELVAAPKIVVPAAEPIDLSVPRLSAFSGRIWGGFAAALFLLGGAVAGSLVFAP